MQLTCPDCQVECTFDEDSAVTVSCPGCGVLLYSKSGNSGSLAAQLAVAAGQRVEITNEDLEKTRQWQKSIDDILPVPDQFPQKLGRYELKQKLGEGSFAEVYLAFDSELGREVALKIPKRSRFTSIEQLRDFLDEGRTSAILEHPGIVRVYDIGWISDEICFISMEHCSRGSLSDRLRSETLTFDEAAELVESLAEAIHFAHVAGFVHRDLKPSNIMFGRDGRPRIVDFGLALSDAEQLNHAGEIAGTLPYMSPEQVRGRAHHLDGRTDIWSLGVILYQLLVGRRPFSGSREQIQDQIRNREAKPLRQIKDDIPAELEDICLRCLKKSPDDRYRTAKDLAKDLHDFRLRPPPVGVGSTARVTVPEPEQAPKTQRSPKSRIANSIFAMLLLFGGFWWALGLIPKQTQPSKDENLKLNLANKHFAGSSVVRGLRYPLLDRRPVEIRWPSDAFPWRYDAIRQALSLDNRSFALLELGSTELDNFEIEIELSKSTWTSGKSGVYWGLHGIGAGDVTEPKSQAALFSIEALFDENQLRLVTRLERLVVSSAGDEHHVVSEVEIEPPINSDNRLILRIGRSAPFVFAAYWNGQLIPKFGDRMLEFWGPEKYQPDGQFGVYNSLGAAAFRDARFLSRK